MNDRRSIRFAAVLFAATAGLGACSPTSSGGGPAITYPPASAAPEVADTPAIDLAVAQLVTALGDQGLTMQDPQRPFRPAEGPALSGTPRAVFQVVLPDAPTHGYVVIYDLPDASRAAAAGADQATYLGTGPGRVQTPIGTRHVIRQLGSTVILYSWNPDATTDERTPRIQDALETIGVEIPVPA